MSIPVDSVPLPSLHVAGKAPESIVDGPGLRYCLFMQGCPHCCPGCHNPETHDVAGGRLVSGEKILDDIRSHPLVRGVTFSGGEPFCQSRELAPLAVALKTCGHHLMAYTGYIWEVLACDPEHRPLLNCLDMLVDGPFVEAQRTLALPFRGSSNQRILDVPASLREGRAVLAMPAGGA